LPIVRDEHKYRNRISIGFGIWVDHNWRKEGWNTEEVSRNYFTPESFEKTVREAFKWSDEYVWIYTETPRWWSDTGKLVKLPGEYDRALRSARQE